MLESVFIFMAAIAFLLFILGIELDSVIYSFLSMMLWVIVMASSLYIEVPSVDEVYSEMGLSAFCLAFIVANIIWLIWMYFKGNVSANE